MPVPNGTSQSECRGQHGPIILVTTAQALPGFGFKKDIELLIDWFNDVLEILDRRWHVGNRLPFLDEQGRQILLRVDERNIGCIEADAVGRVGIEKVPDTMAQDGSDQDVGIEDDHSQRDGFLD